MILKVQLLGSDELLATLCEGSDTESGYGSQSGSLGRQKMFALQDLKAFTSAIFVLKSLDLKLRSDPWGERG